MSTDSLAFFTAAALLAPAAAPLAQETVREVPPGREIRDTKLLTLGKTDKWDLEVAAGEVLLCRVHSQAFDPVLRLVDRTGRVLAENDGRGTRSEIWHRIDRAGAASFEVVGYEGAGGGQYSFFLQRFRTQALAVGETAVHEFGPERWWHFAVRLAEGDVLLPTVTGAGRLTAVFHEQPVHIGAVHGGYRIQASGLHYVRVEGAHEQRCHVRLALARQRDLGADGALRDTLAGDGLDAGA